MTTTAPYATFANKFVIELAGANARVIFVDERGKNLGGQEREVAELVMTIDNLKQLGDLIRGLIEQAQAPAQRN